MKSDLRVKVNPIAIDMVYRYLNPKTRHVRSITFWGDDDKHERHTFVISMTGDMPFLMTDGESYPVTMKFRMRRSTLHLSLRPVDTEDIVYRVVLIPSKEEA